MTFLFRRLVFINGSKYCWVNVFEQSVNMGSFQAVISLLLGMCFRSVKIKYFELSFLFTTDSAITNVSGWVYRHHLQYKWYTANDAEDAWRCMNAWRCGIHLSVSFSFVQNKCVFAGRLHHVCNYNSWFFTVR